MASSKCGACGGRTFEIKLVEPNDSRYKMYFVQCASCGVPVGVMEYTSTEYLLQKQNAAIKRIAAAVGTSVDL